MIFGDWIEDFFVLEAKLMYLWQKRTYYSENFLNSVSEVSDPNNGIFYVFPVITALCAPGHSLPFELMLIGSLLSWTSIQLKWAFGGDRPFWWIKEVAQSYHILPTLRQTHNTCVANPGNPSSHVMVYAGVLLVLANTILAANRNLRGQTSTFTTFSWYPYIWKVGCWGCYLAIMLIIMLSRIYNSANFPHHCILGAFFGVFFANKILIGWNSEWRKKHESALILPCTLLPVLLPVASYWIQKALGIDPQRSVRLAFKWCYSPYDISVSTTSVYYLTCSCGCLFGLGVALFLQGSAVSFYSFGRNSSNGLTFSSLYNNKSVSLHLANSVGVFISACFVFKLQSQIPTDSVAVFYLHHFILNFAAPFLYFAFVPIVLKIITEKLKEKND